MAVIFSEDFTALGGTGARWRAVALLAAAAVSATGSVGVKRWGAGVPPLSLAAVPMLLTGFVVGAARPGVRTRRAARFRCAPGPGDPLPGALRLGADLYALLLAARAPLGHRGLAGLLHRAGDRGAGRGPGAPRAVHGAASAPERPSSWPASPGGAPGAADAAPMPRRDKFCRSAVKSMPQCGNAGTGRAVAVASIAVARPRARSA